MPIVIGLTGPNAAGKGEAAKYLRSKGLTYRSLSDSIREVATERKVEHSREHLIAIGNELRETKCFGVLAAMTVDHIRKTGQDTIVDSIRSPFEVEELRKIQGFFLLGIDAPVEERFARAKARGRNENAQSLEQFKEMEAKENSDKAGSQQLLATFALADKVIQNDSTIEAFHARLGQFWKEHAEGNDHD